MRRIQVAGVKELLKERTSEEILRLLCPGHADELRKRREGSAWRESAAAELLLQRMLRESDRCMDRETKYMMFEGAERELDWHRTPNGKPELSGFRYHFNLSHDNGITACALADVPVGVDIQRITAPRGPVLRRFFRLWEQELVLQAETPALMFTELWVIREAVSKQIGTGLTMDFGDYRLTECETDIDSLPELGGQGIPCDILTGKSEWQMSLMHRSENDGKLQWKAYLAWNGSRCLGEVYTASLPGMMLAVSFASVVS